MEAISFYSTNGEAPEVDLREALLRGQAPDRGLYMPSRFPRISGEELERFRGLEYDEMAYEVLRKFTHGVMDDGVLRGLCEDAYPFDVPLEHVQGRTYVMRLDRGPTASFKDFAARMMARWVGRFVQSAGSRLTILTATSGDTGSAVASAFHGIDGVQVVVLFPRGEVSDRQRKQMTTLKGNISAMEVDGKFDDCQALVKRAFSDPALRRLNLSSANSINIGRLLPQCVYYFYAASRIAEAAEPVVITVPSGNFGNMMGAMIASRMGLAIKRLVVPVNENDAFPGFLHNGEYHKVEPSRNCLSNAMNVGHPSNLARLIDLYGGWIDETGHVHKAPDLVRMRRELFSVSVSDERTRETIYEAWNNNRLLLEPHGAVGWRGFLDYRRAESDDDAPAVVLETAHPAKFPEEIERILGISPEVPASLAALDGLEEDFGTLAVDYGGFREYLLRRYD
ncbi:MAG: threonine synthase [Verrucomicrobia bacterium]|nr:threonine synthase [Verrucomicrobiota bacterium]